jgi:hypothetical protein
MATLPEELCPCNSTSSHSENAPYSLQSISCFAPLGVYSAVLLDGVFRGLLDSCHGFPDWFAGGPALRYPASLEHSTVADDLPFVVH